MIEPTDRSAAKPGRLRVVASTPISEELIERIVRRKPRIDFIRDHTLLPPQRFAGDHSGDPAFHRSPDQQSAFDDLVDSAQALYGVPEEKPAALKRTAEHNPGLLWVHTTAAGGGAQIKAAGLTDDELNRIRFTTSAGVHAEPMAEYALFPGFTLVSVGRGTVIDETALIAALRAGQVGFARWTCSRSNRCPPTARCGATRTS